MRQTKTWAMISNEGIDAYNQEEFEGLSKEAVDILNYLKDAATPRRLIGPLAIARNLEISYTSTKTAIEELSKKNLVWTKRQ